MGEARRRGTFEQRKALAIKRDTGRKRELGAKNLKPAKIPDENERQKRAMGLLTMMSAMSGVSVIMPYKIK